MIYVEGILLKAIVYEGIKNVNVRYVANVGSIKVPEELSDEQVLFLTDVLPTSYWGVDNADSLNPSTVLVSKTHVQLFFIAKFILSLISISPFPSGK